MEAIEIFSEHGIEALRMEDSPPDWAQVGFFLIGRLPSAASRMEVTSDCTN